VTTGELQVQVFSTVTQNLNIGADPTPETFDISNTNCGNVQAYISRLLPQYRDAIFISVITITTTHLNG
jgi:hypothetical protein